MKKILKNILKVGLLSICLIVLYGCSANIPESKQGQLNLVWNRKSNYKIIIGSNASESEKTAAKELQKYIKQMSKCKLPIKVDAKTKISEYEIIIGKTNREDSETYTIEREALGDEGFRILTFNNKIIIAGGEKRGTLYGVYTFLEQLGCRFFTPRIEKVPTYKSIVLETEQLETLQIPAFEYRDAYWYLGFDSNWSAKVKINSGVDREYKKSLGGNISYEGFVHTFNLFVPPATYLAEHPEYYSHDESGKTIYYDGAPAQLCLSNANVLSIMIEKVKESLKNNPNAQIISVSQNDNPLYCKCAECTRIDTEEGSHSGTLIRFVNAVADAIKEEYPDVAIDTLAYYHTLTPPSITKPRENVIIRVCSIGCCFSHPLSTCVNNSSFRNALANWAKIHDRIYVWDYTTNFLNYIGTYPNLGVLQDNMKLFLENNVKGVFEQGVYQRGESGEFAELRTYLLAKLLWDPNTDVEYHMNDFLETYYGEGAEYIKQYITSINESITKKTHTEPEITAMFKHIPEEEWVKFDELWDNAEKAVKDKDTLLRVKRSRLQLRCYNMQKRRGEFADLSHEEYVKKCNEFFQDCLDMGLVLFNEGSRIEQHFQ
ncbi:MAG: DUF4838 domain-containing protein [Clostridia bacterium]